MSGTRLPIRCLADSGALVLCVVSILLFAPGRAAARDCAYENGEARWAIKTSIPPQSGEPQSIDLASLIALDNPEVGANLEDTRWDGGVTARADAGGAVALHEGDLVTVSGYLYRARCQKDGDYHLEIGNKPTRANARCLIVEVPDPDQIPDADLRTSVAAARDALAHLDASVFQSHPRKAPIRITVTGQLFFDQTHHRHDPGGGRGTLLNSGRHCASNLWELHPVTSLGSD